VSIAHVLPAFEGSARDALSLGTRLARIARETRSVTYGAAVARERAVALGRWQRADRVLDLNTCASHGVPVLRRATSGTAVALSPGGTAVLALALPSLTALVPDTRGPTVLNRNVRGWLRGLSALGGLAHYFGREWISIARRPGGVLALSVPRDGTVILELWIGMNAPVSLPADLASPTERALDRWLGKAPAAWSDLAHGELSLAGLDAIAARAAEHHHHACAILPVTANAPNPAPDEPAPDEPAPDEPGPDEPGPDARWLDPVPCPIGWIDLAERADGSPWVGGDLLLGETARDALLRAIAEGDPSERAPALTRCVEQEITLGASVNDLSACGARWTERVRSGAS
jgi:hypothetical protein